MANTFTVIGLGAFGSSAAQTLQDLGNTVIGMDSDKNIVNRLNEKLPHTVIGDATSRAALEEIDVAQSQGVLVSIGENLEASLLCVFNLKELGVTNIWVKAKSDAHRKIFRTMGVAEKNIILPEFSMGKRIGQRMHFPLMHEMLQVSSDFFLIALDLPESEEPLTVGALQLKYPEVRLMTVCRDKKPLEEVIGAETVLKNGDRLVMAGSYNALRPMIVELKNTSK